VLSLGTAMMIAAVVNPAGRLGPVLGWRPLRWIGVRSYGIYLWQWPIIVFVGQSQNGFDLPRAVVEVAATVLIASLSWRYVEEPIRHGALGRLWRQVRFGARRFGARRRRTVALSASTAFAFSLAVVSLSGVLPVASAGGNSTNARAAGPPKPLSGSSAAYAAVSTHKAKTAAPPPTHTSCRSVVYIGDSTSEGEISTDYIPNPKQRLQAQLADVGVTTVFPEISGARSIVETFEGLPNAATVALDHVQSGFHGCWILAMGTNDVDNVAGGGVPGLDGRIQRMMSVIGNQPVMWVDLITLLGSGPYQESSMQVWNKDLLSQCSRYPNMRVYDWAVHAKTKWFIPDGIHYYSPGYVARTHDIAQGLAKAFPAGGSPSASCVVS
jgi:hypothetical protein